MSTASRGRLEVRPSLLAAVGLALALLGPAAHAQQTTAPRAGQSTLTYRILRDGRDLGRQSMIFREQNGATEVEVVTHVQVTVGGMQVYEFQQNIREVWRERRLVQFNAHANDNGERHTVELSPTAGRSLLVVDGKRTEVPAEIASTTLWHPFMLKRPLLFDTLHGDLREVRLRDEGEVVVRVADREMTARLYVLTGGAEAQVVVRAGRRPASAHGADRPGRVGSHLRGGALMPQRHPAWLGRVGGAQKNW